MYAESPALQVEFDRKSHRPLPSVSWHQRWLLEILCRSAEGIYCSIYILCLLLSRCYRRFTPVELRHVQFISKVFCQAITFIVGDIT